MERQEIEQSFTAVITALGQVTMSYNLMEQEFKQAFRVLLNAPLEVGVLMANRRRSFSELTGLVCELFELYVTDEPARERLKGICAEAKHLEKQRNQLVHSSWALDQNASLPAIRFKDGQPKESLNAENLLTIAQQMEGCEKALQDHMVACFPDYMGR